jgi:hypothetical protein
MKLHKLYTVAAAVFFVAIFSAQAAQADPPLRDIIEEFCDDVIRISAQTLDDVSEAANDLQSCASDYRDCQFGQLSNGPVSCLIESVDCAQRAQRDSNQACISFASQLGNTYEDALRNARRNGPGVERRFQAFLLTDLGAQCLQPADTAGSTCAALSD